MAEVRKLLREEKPKRIWFIIVIDDNGNLGCL